MLRCSPPKQVGTEIRCLAEGLTDNILQAISALFYHHITSSISPTRSSSVTLHQVLRTIMLAHIAAGTPRPRAKMWLLRTKLFLTSLQPVGHIR
jgi:hypothetical protein